MKESEIKKLDPRKPTTNLDLDNCDFLENNGTWNKGEGSLNWSNVTELVLNNNYRYRYFLVWDSRGSKANLRRLEK